MNNTDIPTVDQLADFREARCGNQAASWVYLKFDVHTGEAIEGGEDALAPPKYWDDVKDPTVVQYFRVTSKTHADEYERVLGAFMLTLDPSAFQCIHQIVAARLLDGVAVCGLTVRFIGTRLTD